MELTTEEKIRTIMSRKKLTISEVANRCGWKQANFSNKLNRNNFNEADLRKIAEALDCNLEIEFIEK